MASKPSFVQVSEFAPLNRVPLASLLPHDRDFDWGFDFDSPFEQLSIFVRHIDSAAPIARLPIFALVDFGLTAASRRQLSLTGAAPTFPVLPLGVIGTDHVGYGSFDLWPASHFSVLEGIRQVLADAGLLVKGKPRPQIGLARLRVLPFKDPAIAFDALIEGDLAPDYITLRIDMDEAMLAGRGVWPPMPAMQTPGILDCRLSPGSFSMAGALLIGEDGCETLLPGNLASRLVRFSQLLRTLDSAEAVRQQTLVATLHPPDLSGTIRLGYLVEYGSEWFPLGHSLGQIAYSLPLAPAEKIKVAVVDWTRRDVAKRTEQTSEAEDLQHAALRDRSLSEAVNMVVRESQSGSSFMAGGALSAGAGIPLGPVSLGIGGAFGIGGASTKSQGMRSVVADTTQKISDAFHQASSAMRELNSTVVIQGEQAEKSEARTRVVVNYNHSHALTILYYEVLQHFRIVTRPAKTRPVLFLKYEAEGFGDVEAAYVLIERYRRIIAANLLDESLRTCLDTVVKRQCLKQNLEREKARRAALGDPLDDLFVGDVTVTVRSGAVAATLNVMIDLETNFGGQLIPCHFEPHLIASLAVLQPPNGPPIPPQTFPDIFLNLSGTAIGDPALKPNTEFVFRIKPSTGVRWKNVAAIGFVQTFTPLAVSASTASWIIEDVRATTSSAGSQWVMHNGKPSPNLVPQGGRLRIPVDGFKPPTENADDLLSNEELCCLRRLLDHLDRHRGHYWRAIWLGETATDRAVRLDPWELNGTPLLDLVDNELLGFEGEFAIMPAAAGTETALSRTFNVPGLAEPDLPANQYVEQVLTLPARGVFAEAKLGHCNASELIDQTRFWDWQQSPIPDDPPEIAPASTESLAQDPTKGLAPTPFPAAMVNIVNPQAIPDPAGLSAAAGVLSALGPFRDMSGIKELGPFLQTLSNNATQLASQGLKNAQTPALMNAIRGAPELTPEIKAKLIEEVLTGQVRSAPALTAPQISPAAPAAGAPPGAPGTPVPGPPATPAPAAPAVPAAPPPQTPSSKPPPQRPTTISPKTNRIRFNFSYDSNHVMMGSWQVKLVALSGAEFESSFMTNTLPAGASGGNVGNVVDMDVPASFGGGDPVTIQIHGMIVALPETISAGTRVYETKVWSQPFDFTADFTADTFRKTKLYRVVQPTDAVDYSIKRTVQDTAATTVVTGKSTGLEVGVENAVEVGGTIGVAEAKDTIKVNAKGTVGWIGSQQNLNQITGGFEETVQFKGRMVSALAPKISPL